MTKTLCALLLAATCLTACGDKDKDSAQKVAAQPDKVADEKQQREDEKAKEKVKEQKGSFVAPE